MSLVTNPITKNNKKNKMRVEMRFVEFANIC